MRCAPRLIVLATALVAAGLTVGARRVDAQGWTQGPITGWFSEPAPRPRPPERMRRYEPRRERMAVERPRQSQNRIDEIDSRQVTLASKPGTASALVAVVSLRSQTITVWDQTGPVLRSRVSTGQSGHDTPTGLFSVIQKNRYHESNIYSGAPMPWMHRITWSGIALHAGVVPNYPASHGCIRLPYDFAPKLWGLSRIGMRVVVAPDDAGLHMVDHESLPQPKFLTLSEVDDAMREQRGEQGVRADGARVLLASVEPERLIGPSEFAQRLKKEAAAAVEIKKRNAREALAVSVQASAEANAAADDLRAARAELADAEAAVRALAADIKGRTEAARTSDESAGIGAAEARALAAGQRVEAAVFIDAQKNAPAFAAARAARDAELAADDAPDQARDAARRLEPVSILISGKEGMIFVRQGFEPVMDARIEIDDALEPLGTHVFTAMAPAAGGTRLAWSAVTMPSSRHAAAGSAIEALQRITIPEKVRQEISRRVWTGASLIVSDEGISNETGRGTDFVVLTK